MKICCLQTIFEEHCDSLKSIFRLLHNEKRAVHNIAVYCEERYAERKNKEKSCYTDFQETDFRVLVHFALFGGRKCVLERSLCGA